MSGFELDQEETLV
ncbi:hypothetical protein YPPY71_2996, partial [Yersinia pestis PY-71]